MNRDPDRNRRPGDGPPARRDPDTDPILDPAGGPGVPPGLLVVLGLAVLALPVVVAQLFVVDLGPGRSGVSVDVTVDGDTLTVTYDGEATLTGSDTRRLEVRVDGRVVKKVPVPFGPGETVTVEGVPAGAFVEVVQVTSDGRRVVLGQARTPTDGQSSNRPRVASAVRTAATFSTAS